MENLIGIDKYSIVLDEEIFRDLAALLGASDQKSIRAAVHQAVRDWIDTHKADARHLADFQNAILTGLQEEREGLVRPLAMLGGQAAETPAWSQIAPPFITTSAVNDLKRIGWKEETVSSWLDQFTNACGQIERPERKEGTPLFWQTVWDNRVIAYSFASGRMTVLRLFPDARRIAALRIPEAQDAPRGTA